jgi:branched-subunit amino acid aminotransferase/4-amino-4-deoxychorismate lyase
MDFLIINGEIIRKEDANLTPLFWEKSFTLSQKIWFGLGGIPLFNKNIEFLCQQLSTFNIEPPKFLKETRELFRISKRMLNKNKFYRSGLINVQLFLTGSQINYVITSHGSTEFEFPISKQGLLVNFSELQKYSANRLNQHSFYSTTNWEIINSQLRNSNFSNSILLNEKGMICEGIASNIFMVKDHTLITPSIESGCFEDTIRNPILEIAGKLQLKTFESPKTKREDIIGMNEVFFASEEYGIQWVLGIENRRYVHKVSEQIYEHLNNYLKSEVD